MMVASRPVALVTGAGSGIGRATAVRLDASGYRIVLAGRRPERLRETGALLGNEWLAVRADLSEMREAEGIVEAAVARFGRLDALVNNAGWSPAATIAETTPAIIAAVFAVNAHAPAASIARAWPHFVRRGAGVVVNVSSYATVDPFPQLYAYAAAKASVNLLARSVANAGRGIGVRGFAVAPGAVETELLRAIVPEAALPTDRTLNPDAVAATIAACVLGAHDDRNGEVILLPSP